MTAVAKMVSLSEEMKVFMPEIIALSPSSPNFDTRVKLYWDSIAEPIPIDGKTLETGFVYDITSVDKQPYITNINAQLKQRGEKELKTDEDLLNYIQTKWDKVEEDYNKAVINASKLGDREREEALKLAYTAKYDAIWVIESEHFKFGKPINVFEYLLWKYCLVYSQVANEFSFVNKSENIRFYLTSEEAKRQAEKRKMKTQNLAMQKYLEIISSKQDVLDILFALQLGEDIMTLSKTLSGEDLDLQLHILLKQKMDNDPETFTKLASDKNVTTKGLIEKYITFNILKRLQGTDIIVDYIDPSKIIGNNLDEAISFFSNQENAAIASEYMTKFKDLNSKLV